MFLGKYEYTQGYLSQAPRRPALSSFLPMIVYGYCYREGFGEIETKLYMSLALLASVLNIYFFAPSKSLIHGNKSYRYQVSSLFVFLIALPFVLVAFFSDNPLAELFGWLLFAIGIVANMLLHTYWYKGSNLEPLGWYTNERLTEPAKPLTSPLGNSFAKGLGVIVLFGAIALFGKIAIGIIELNQ